MTPQQQWIEANQQYLGLALEWLRAKLEGVKKTGAAALKKAAKGDPPPALEILARRFGLSAFEKNVLLMAAAAELDTRMGSLFARAQEDERRSYPTFALAMARFDNPAWDALAPSRPLRYWRLIEVRPSGAEPLVSTPIRADERIVNYIKGLNYLDESLASFVFPMPPPEPGALPPSQAGLADAVVEAWGSAQGRALVIQLVGRESAGKQLLARRAAESAGLQLYRLPVDLLPANPLELDNLARLWQREGFLLPLLLYLDASGTDGQLNDVQGAALQAFLARNPGPLLLDTREPLARLYRPGALIEVGKPTAAEQQQEWRQRLGPAVDGLPERLAGQFNLSVPEIRAIAAAHEPVLDDPDRAGALAWDACRAVTRPRIEALAQRIVPKARWEDLVLPEPELQLLRQIVDQVSSRSVVYDQWGFRARMSRGFGITALFAGESGTGKTLAAEVMAGELRLDLYRIDLSGVVSKYIGETEKNLRRLFDAAEDGGAILLFDEADALFGKRSEVKDSHDRYANIEIDYLLQRMEAYNGLAVLTTNMKSALDPAFVRRLRFIVQFPFPAPAERRAIWEKALPPETPREGLDYDRLARLNLTGGSIHQVALNAAFLAAQAGSGVTMPLLLRAARNEFVKMERPVNEGDFQWKKA
jgi:hypothetical protein